MIDCQNLSELDLTLTINSPGGRDQPLRGRQWHPSFPPPPLPPTVHLPQPVTAGVNLSICASLCHPSKAGTRKCISKLWMHVRVLAEKGAAY